MALVRDVASLWKTVGGTLRLVSRRVETRELERAIRAKYSDARELQSARRQSALGLTAGERAMLERVLVPGARVLDIGCAAGRVSLALHREGARPVGVDVTEAMVREAATLAGRAGAAVAFVAMDARRLGLRSESFDVVLLIGSVICYVRGRSERRRVFHEVRRVLKPGGRLLLVTPSRDYSWRFRAWFGAMASAHRLLGRIGRATADWEPGDRVGPAWSGDRSRLVYWYMYSPTELVADLQASGLEIVEAHPDAYMMAVTARRP